MAAALAERGLTVVAGARDAAAGERATATLVATDMGGAGAPRTPEQGAASVLWAVDLPDCGGTGGFFRDGRRLPW